MAFLFTIEQIELVRRLRRTGMSREQVWRAYEEMDRLDAELNGLSSGAEVSTDNSPKPLSNGPKQSSKSLTTNTSQTLPQIEFNSNSLHEICAKTVASYTRNGCQPFGGQTLAQTQHNNNSCTSYPSTSLDKSSSSLPAFGCLSSHAMDIMSSDQSQAEEELSPKEPSITITPIQGPTDGHPSNSLVINTSSGNHLNSRYFGSEEPQELVEFKKKGETVMLNEIRGFVNKYNIRQIMIAEMTKISQGYVSRFFRGEGQDMSDKSKNLIYLWYLSCRQRPEILTQFCPQTIGERRGQLSEAGDLLPIRRDRFIFRKEHLMILDKYFKDNPYPDASTKEVIAEECNQYIERQTQRTLKERDKVTISVVSNWFNNKRKEVKTKRGPCSQTVVIGGDMDTSNGHPISDQSNHHSFYSNHSNCSVEELETRPDLSILTDFGRHEDSIELSDVDEVDDSQQQQQTYVRDQSDHYLNDKLKNNFQIKLEPTY